jgi:hypothetical protein
MIDVSMLVTALWLEESPLPSPLPEEPPIDPSRVTPGLLGFISFVFLVVAVVLLYRSMRKQMSKVNPDLPSGPGDRERWAERQAQQDEAQQDEAQLGADQQRPPRDPDQSPAT